MRILAFAYACEPGKGSEPGAGWVWARMLARLGEAWIVTRANNRDAIEAEHHRIPERDNLHFEYVDLPEWARFWKRRQHGVRLYYILWQAAALRRALRLHRSRRFDLVWHLTLANAWIGSLAPLVGPRFVYGPVGGGVRMPWNLAGALGMKGILYELTRAAARLTGRFLNPLARLAWRKAEIILVQNPETLVWLPARHRSKATVFPHAVLEQISDRIVRRAEGRPIALYAGRLIPWKGVALAVRAVADLPRWRLVICGSGPDEARLRRLSRRLGVENRVEFRGWKPRNDLLRVMREEAHAFLFPSLHDEAGWVIAEAMACDLPVVCMNHGGPPSLGGAAVDSCPVHGDAGTVARALAQRLEATEHHTHQSRDREARDLGLEAVFLRLAPLLVSPVKSDLT